MLLKYMKLKNFRQYKGEQLIEFSSDKEKNITVILGDNTSGKTTFVQSFNWVLYGQTDFVTKKLLNMDVAVEMPSNSKREVSAELVFEHEENEYRLVRTISYMKKPTGIVDSLGERKELMILDKIGKAKVVDIDEIDNVINNILPKNLSGYFFFDGEKIEKISEKKDMKDAVKNLLGLQALESAAKHINPNNILTVGGKFRGAIQDSADGEFTRAKKAFDENVRKKADLVKEKDDLDKELQKCRERIDEVRTELAQYKNMDGLKGREKRIKEQKERAEQRIKSDKDMFKSRVSSEAQSFFIRPLLEKSLKVLEREGNIHEGIPNLTSKSIEHILHRGYCLCGTKIEEGSEVYNHIKKEQSFVPPQSVGTAVRFFKKESEKTLKGNNDFYQTVEKYITGINEAKKDILAWDKELAEIDEQLMAGEKADSIKRDFERLRVNEATIEGRISAKDQAIGSCKQAIEVNNTIMEKNMSANKRNKEIKRYLDYAQALYAYLLKDYEIKETELRNALNTKVNDLFHAMYHGKRSVVINKDYTVELIVADETYISQEMKLDESRGLETVKNFAFISGILEIAKDKIISKNVDLFDDEPEPQEVLYPLVMDAPFSNADEKHVSKISSVLPSVADQVIMVVMEKDWKYAQETINNKVGKQYRIDKKSETESYIKGE